MGKIKKDKANKMREALQIVSKGVPDMITVNHMTEEIVCPTIFTSLNRATGIGGIPRRKMIAMHGPNSTGKSVLATGLAESLRRGMDVPVIYEAEYASEKRWMNKLVLGKDTLFKMPLNMDELFNDIQTNLTNLAEGKKAGKLPDSMGIAFVIDTLTKLIPEEQWAAIMKEGIKKSYPMAAMWVSVWTKVIVPQAYRSNSTFIIVLQERQKLDAVAFGKKRKPTLGESLLYDVSMRIECTHTKPVVKQIKKEKVVIGAQHFYKLEKNKVDGFTAQAGSFFTSTGKHDTPPGFDIVREAIEEGKQRGTLKQNSKKTAISFGEEEFEGGWEDFREALQADESKRDRLIDFLNSEARNAK